MGTSTLRGSAGPGGPWLLLVLISAVDSVGSGCAPSIRAWPFRGSEAEPTSSLNSMKKINDGVGRCAHRQAQFWNSELKLHKFGLLRLRGGKRLKRQRSDDDDNDYRSGRRAEAEASMKGKAVMDNWTRKGQLKDEPVSARVKEGKKRKPWREPLDKGEKLRKGRRSWQTEGDDEDSMESFISEDGGIGGKLEDWLNEEDSHSEVERMMAEEVQKQHDKSAGLHEESDEPAPVKGSKSKAKDEESDAELEFGEEDEADMEEKEGDKEWVPGLNRFVDKRKMEGDFVEVSDEWSEEALASSHNASRTRPRAGEELGEVEGPAPAEEGQGAPLGGDLVSSEEAISLVDTVINGIRCRVRVSTGEIYNEGGREIGVLDEARETVLCNASKHVRSPFLIQSEKKRWFAKDDKDVVEEGEEIQGEAIGLDEEKLENEFDRADAFDLEKPTVVLGGGDTSVDDDSVDEDSGSEPGSADEDGAEEERGQEDVVRKRLLELSRDKAAKIARGEAAVLDGGFMTFRDDELPHMEAAHVFDPATKQFKAGGGQEALKALKAAGVLGTTELVPSGSTEGEATEHAKYTASVGLGRGGGEGGRRMSSLERALAKKLRQVEAIEAKLAAGENVTDAQRDKLEKKRELQAQLALFKPDAVRDGARTRNRFAGADNRTSGAEGTEPPPAGRDMSAWKALRLHPLLLIALRNLFFTAPTPIQDAAVRAALWEGCDLIGVAETGAGKTLAFGLPILHTILTLPASDPLVVSKSLVALVVCPTRELAMQVHRHLQALCGQGRERVRAVAIVGGLSDVKQRRQLKQQPQIVVGTPGRLWELIEDGEAHLVRGLRSLRFVVLDEADRLVSTGHFKEVRQLLERLPEARGRSAQQRAKQQRKRAAGAGGADPAEQLPVRQGFLFSATYEVRAPAARAMLAGSGNSSAHDREDKVNMVKLGKRLLRMSAKPRVVDVTSNRVVASRVKQVVVKCSPEQKDDYLYFFLRHNPGRTIVFINHISVLRRLTALLVAIGVEARPLHAAMQQRARLRNIDLFRARQDVVLVSTDVAARGLDIPTVQHVVHFDVPPNADTYTHRAGRAAHQPGAPKGYSLLIVDPRDGAGWTKARDMTDGFRGAMQVQVHSSQLKTAASLIVRGRRLANLRMAVSKERANAAWKKKTADDMGIEEEEEEGSPDSDGEQPQTVREMGQATEDIKKLEMEIAGLLPPLRREIEALGPDPATPQNSTGATKGNETQPPPIRRPKGVIVGGRAQLDWLNHQQASSTPPAPAPRAPRLPREGPRAPRPPHRRGGTRPKHGAGSGGTRHPAAAPHASKQSKQRAAVA